MPLVVLSRRRLTVSSEMRLLNDLFCRLSGGVPKGYRAIRVDVCASKSSRSRHSVRHAFRPAVEHLLDFRKEELLDGWIGLGKRRPIEIAKVCETISLIHSALSSRIQTTPVSESYNPSVYEASNRVFTVRLSLDAVPHTSFPHTCLKEAGPRSQR